MSGPSRSYSFNQNDEDTLRPGRQQQPHYSPHDNISPPPPPPAHRIHPAANAGTSYQHSHGAAPVPPNRESMVTPGADSVGSRAVGGGITGIATGVANTNERDSGVQALRDIDSWGRNPGSDEPAGRPRPFPSQNTSYNTDYSHPYGNMQPPESPTRAHYNGSNTAIPFAGAGYAMGSGTPPVHQYGDRGSYHEGTISPYSASRGYQDGTITPYSTSSHSNSLRPGQPYMDNPYNRNSRSREELTQSAVINPNDIYDDGEDDTMAPNMQKRRSVLGGFGNKAPAGAAGAAGSAALGAVALGSFNRDGSGAYNPVSNGTSGVRPDAVEKSAWLRDQADAKKRKRRIITWIIAVVVVLAIIGGVVGGILASQSKANNDGPSRQGLSADDDLATNGDLGKDSSEIKALLNNNDLHRVFPGVDYTPINAQYPECISFPPSQNNVTRDVAILSQLSTHIRLYGTDCNQTQMVLHAIERLEIPDMKIWLGVHLDANETTNTRQLEQFYDILDQYGDDPFAGVIIGNEVLFREDMTSARLGQELAFVRSNMTSKSINLPLASADLGDNWTTELASEVDVVMANIHPFFGGTPADESAQWTWDFWTQRDIPLTAGMTGKRHVISEVGWPSTGGNKCATGVSPCPDGAGSVAGINEMNTFMEGFVCESLRQNYTFFWFEAFDEPWKIRFNTKDENWEDKWGLLDVNRKLKTGVKIPECAGIPVPN